MQVSLAAIDWEQLIGFGTAEEYLEKEFNGEVEVEGVSCYEEMHWGDSAICYFGVACVLKHLTGKADAETAAHLNGGLCKVIAENNHPDEFEMSQASEGCYMLSMSPSTVKEVKAHIDATDLEYCKSILRDNPAPEEKEIQEDLEDTFTWVINQYTEMVNVAASRNLGLLMHCG